MSILTAGRAPGIGISRTSAQALAFRAMGAALALAVAYIHVKDQGGLPGDKSPSYMGIGYWMLEIVGVMVAIALLVGSARHTAKVWFLAIGVAAGPIVGYILSRGPGLPDYTDDKGVWTEQLGVIALSVETALLVLAVSMWIRARRQA